MCLIDPSCVHSASTNTLSYQPPADNRTPPPGSLPSGLAPWPSALRAVLPTSPDALVLRLRTRRVSTDTPDRRFSVAPHADAMVGSTATAFNGGGGRSKAVPSAVNTRHTHSMPLLAAGAGVDAGADSTSLPSPDVPSLGLEPAPAPPPAPAVTTVLSAPGCGSDATLVSPYPGCPSGMRYLRRMLQQEFTRSCEHTAAQHTTSAVATFQRPAASYLSHVYASERALPLHPVGEHCQLRTRGATHVQHIVTWAGRQRSHSGTGRSVDAIDAASAVRFGSDDLHLSVQGIEARKPRDACDRRSKVGTQLSGAWRLSSAAGVHSAVQASHVTHKITSVQAYSRGRPTG